MIAHIRIVWHRLKQLYSGCYVTEAEARMIAEQVVMELSPYMYSEREQRIAQKGLDDLTRAIDQVVGNTSLGRNLDSTDAHHYE